MKWSILNRSSLYILKLLYYCWYLPYQKVRYRGRWPATAAPRAVDTCTSCTSLPAAPLLPLSWPPPPARRPRTEDTSTRACSMHDARPSSAGQRLINSCYHGKSSAAAAAACIRRRGASLSLSLALPHLIRRKSAPISQLKL